MQSLTIHTWIGKDGLLKLETPVNFRDAEVDVVLVVNAVTSKIKTKKKRAKGWPPGFFERTFGSIPDLPERGPQGEYEIRDILE
jgi:hypothetical protein